MLYINGPIYITGNVSAFKDLYAPVILFYGQQLDEQECIKKKASLLKKSFQQEILTPIKVTFYASGVIKCDFTKLVTSRKKTKGYFSYLLLEKRGENFVITGESDLITDQNLHVQLNLGQELDTSGYTLYIAGALLITILIIYSVIRKRKRNRLFAEFMQETSVEENISVTGIEETVAMPSALEFNRQSIGAVKFAAIKESAKTNTSLSEEEKGRAFENFVVSKFSKEYFTLLEWRSDKFYDGRYAETSKLPDLELRFNSKTATPIFAVECKWRKNFYRGKIEWAKKHQLTTYRNYEQEKAITVFVIIGIGGEPSSPEFVYIIPLKEIYSTALHQSWLDKYRRYRTGSFFLHAADMVLK